MYGIAGGENGKISIMKDQKTGVRTIPHVGTLEEFTSKIKKIVKLQESDTHKNN